MAELRRVAIALGSNLGDRRSHLLHAITRLHSVLAGLSASTLIETEPDGVGPQPHFLNGAVVGSSAEPPEAILDDLLAIERERGRERPFKGAPRTLDLDLILVDDLVITSSALRLPHPRFRERPFVLRPLAEVAPEMSDPVTGLSVRELLERLA